jgi:hypothetical protein
MALTKAPKEMLDVDLATEAYVDAAVAASSGGSSGLLRMTVFTSSGTWTKQADVSQIIVELVGGGGGGSSFGSSGGTSSFGAHCSATGGTRGGSAVATAGLGGSGSGGNINAKGNDGMWGVGGDSFLGKGSVSNRNVAPPNSGCGAGTNQASPTVWGGGAGGYSKKLITAQSLGATETVTIGAGGNGNGADLRGGSGLVIIYEYGG